MKSTFVKKIMTVEITNTNYETLFQNNPGLCILEFGGAHCAPCVILLQHLDALSMEYKDEVLVGTVDYYAFSDLAIKFGVRATPTLLFIKNGEILEKQVGYSSKKVLEDKIKRHLHRD
jgi:thioredoxin 1